MSVKEISTCEYEVIILTPDLCENPAFMYDLLFVLTLLFLYFWSFDVLNGVMLLVGFYIG